MPDPSRVMLIAAGAALLAFMSTGAVPILRRAWRRRPRRDDGAPSRRCGVCGYPHSDATSPCPECGAVEIRLSPRTRLVFWGGGLLGVLIVPVAAMVAAAFVLDLAVVRTAMTVERLRLPDPDRTRIQIITSMHQMRVPWGGPPQVWTTVDLMLRQGNHSVDGPRPQRRQSRFDDAGQAPSGDALADQLRDMTPGLDRARAMVLGGALAAGIRHRLEDRGGDASTLFGNEEVEWHRTDEIWAAIAPGMPSALAQRRVPSGLHRQESGVLAAFDGRGSMFTAKRSLRPWFWPVLVVTALLIGSTTGATLARCHRRATIRRSVVDT